MHRTAAAPRVHISADDDHLTGFAGLLLSGELIRRTRLVARIDGAVEGVRAFKQRRRGRSAGELLVSLAEAMMAGGNHLAHLEVLRQDGAGAGLRAVAETPAPTTAGQLLRRLTVAQLRAALAATAEAGNVLDADLGLDATAPVTLDIDATTTEVYGRQKQGAAFNYEGRFSYKSQLVTWAERHRVLTAELHSGNSAAKPTAPRLLDAALARLPQGHGPVSVRGNSNYFCSDVMQRCRRRRVRFAVSVPRNRAMWRASYRMPEEGWRPALEMPGAEIAETTYRPSGWAHEPLRLLIRRRLLEVAELGSGRARRRRTVPLLQLRAGPERLGEPGLRLQLPPHRHGRRRHRDRALAAAAGPHRREDQGCQAGLWPDPPAAGDAAGQPRLTGGRGDRRQPGGDALGGAPRHPAEASRLGRRPPSRRGPREDDEPGPVWPPRCAAG